MTASTARGARTWGEVFVANGGQRAACPAGDGPVQAGESAVGCSDGRVWHDDCAEAAGAYGAVHDVYEPGGPGCTGTLDPEDGQLEHIGPVCPVHEVAQEK